MSGVETTEILPAAAAENGAEGAAFHTTEQVGAASFSDLVRAHFRREQERATSGRASKDADDDYEAKLERFEKEEGRLGSVYWSTHNASAVALTIGKARNEHNPFAETDIDVRLHRVTDWVTRNAEPLAVLLHECDVLAIRVREILRGTSQRIALQWIYSIQEHTLGFIERSERRSVAKEEEMIASQRKEMARIEKYYLRTGSKAGRIVYVSGMLTGATFLVAVSAGAAFLLKFGTGSWDSNTKALVLCTGAGAVGALVSVLSRMSGGDDSSFSVDFEVGRPMLRRLGLYKPFVGSVFSVATYFLLVGGLLPTKPTDGASPMFFYGIIGFLAGFSERFTGVIFGNAERLIGGDSAAPPPQEETDSTTQ